uniref:Retrovirus-related Pol polyprotein from transposon TNT 1-94 n=1 Tax=Nelumbo nucifera TaxID=4432 RepID=A0A822ZFV7_NELNU|nr:TPA_asm: hypothetical protein HUJ06_001997 [Nelumbo nucifera]
MTLESIFATKSTTCAVHIRDDLVALRKGDSSMTDYLQTLKSYNDELFALREPLSTSQLIHHALEGLPSKYDALVTALSMRSTDVAFKELQGMLMQHKTRLHCITLDPLRSVNTASTHPGRHHNVKMLTNSGDHCWRSK